VEITVVKLYSEEPS